MWAREHQLWTALTLAAAAWGTWVGCGGGSLATVEGNITFDGQPVEKGSIIFEPAGGTGPSAAGPVENGKYRLDSTAGLAPGKMKVRITAVRSTGRKIEAGPPAPPGTKIDEVSAYLPTIYNDQSTLTAEIVAGKNTQNFELRSPPPRR